MSGAGEPLRRGRLVLVAATAAEERGALAAALQARLDRAVVVDGEALENAVVGPGDRAGWSRPPTGPMLRMRLLRWSAALAVAETYQLEGFDAVVAEDALGDGLEDFLDLAAPEPVHVVVVRGSADPATPHWGIWVDGDRPADDADEVADDVVARLPDARVVTADQP